MTRTTTARTTGSTDILGGTLQIGVPLDPSWRDVLNDVTPGRDLRFLFFVQNTGEEIARDVQVNLSLTANNSGGNARGTITAANAATLTPTTHFAFHSAVPRVRLYYTDAWIYRDQNEDARFCICRRHHAYNFYW